MSLSRDFSLMADTPAKEFPISEQWIYLNHAAIGPWPTRTAAAITRFTELNVTQSVASFAPWIEIEREARALAARMFGGDASPEDIAFCKNTSEALSLLASGFPWPKDANVVLAAHEFSSNRLPWVAQRPRIEVREVDTQGGDAASALIDACDASTALITTSSVQYGTGERVDVPRLAEYCNQNDIVLCVDAIQSLGALVCDAVASGADFVAAGSHKWLLSPEGVGMTYIAPKLRERIVPLSWGWRMLDDLFDFSAPGRKPSSTGRRFEAGTLNTLGLVGLHSAMQLFEEIGMVEVERMVRERATLLREGLTGKVSLVTPAEEKRNAGIVSFTTPHANELFSRLREEGIIVAARGDKLRLSPHFYTPIEQLEQALDRLLAMLRELK